MIQARIPKAGERVRMGRLATAWRGVEGTVVRVEHTRTRTARMNERGTVQGRAIKTQVYILTDLTHEGKRVMLDASPYELEGAVPAEYEYLQRVVSRR